MIPTLTAEHLQQVSRLLLSLTKYWPAHPEVAELGAKTRLLPMSADWNGIIGLDEKGESYLALYDAPDQSKPLLDQRLRTIAFAEAARRYGELGSLRPFKGETDVTCPACDGTGTLASALAIPVVCWCGGLGWVPVGHERLQMWAR